MAGTKKMNKAKARATVITTYEVLAGMDGNPNTPKEFDESPHDDDEVYFKADDDATQVRRLPPSPHQLHFHSIVNIVCAALPPTHSGARHAFSFEQTELIMSLNRPIRTRCTFSTSSIRNCTMVPSARSPR